MQYLAYLTRLFPDDLPRALAAYNAGENAVLKYGGIPPYDETQTYVKRAMTVYYGRPYGGGAVDVRRTPRRQEAARRLRRPRPPSRRLALIPRRASTSADATRSARSAL